MSKIPKFPRLSSLRGDAAGGLTAAIITFPQAIGYGLLAFAPLGADFAGTAAALGIYSAVIAGFLASLFGSTAIQITGPKVPLTLLVAVLVGQLAVDPRLALSEEARVLLVLGGVSFSVLVGGLFQVFLGWSGIGSVAKYVPYPVVSGFMNGVAVLLILKQVPVLLGAQTGVGLPEMFTHPEAIRPLTLLVGGASLAGILLAKRYLKRLPAYVIGIAAGTAVHHGLALLDTTVDPGNTIGSFGFRWPVPVDVSAVFDAAMRTDGPDLLPLLLATGMAIGLIGALESLFSCVVSDNLTNERHESNRELVSQGIGNLACALVSALPAAGSVPRSRANFAAGGRTRLSGVLAAGFVFVFFWALGAVVEVIPLAAIAAMLVFVGIDLFDGWTVSLVRKLRAQASQRRLVFLDLAVAAAVAAITVSVNLMVAVGVGIAAASVLFIARTGNAVIRRSYDGRAVRSRKMRAPEQERCLTEAGQEIVVFELQGPLFFGSGDKLIAGLAEVPADLRYLVLDMRNVTDIDSTGTRMLPQLKALLESAGKHLLISQLTDHDPRWQFLELMGLVDCLGRRCFFDTTDGALEWAEEQVLARAGCGASGGDEVALERSALAEGMTERELHHLRQSMNALHYRAGEVIFREGDRDSTMLLVLRGSVTIKQALGGNRGSKRIFTYGPGSVIGELALLDRLQRSASAWADSDVELLSLSPGELANLKAQRPELAVTLLANLARVVSMKLRRASSELAALENA